MEQDQGGEGDEFEGDESGGGGASSARTGAGRRRQTLVLGATGGGSLMTAGAGAGGLGGGVGGDELVGAFTDAQLNSASDRFREAWMRIQVRELMVRRGCDRDDGPGLLI